MCLLLEERKVYLLVAQHYKARDTPGLKFWVKISPERDQVLEMMGAHANQS